MAITTYATLKTAVEAWMNRSDSTTTGEIDTFIDLCEAEINRNVRHRQMEQRVTTTVTSEYAELPSDFLEMRSIKLNSNPNVPIRFESPQNFIALRATNTTQNNDPVFYTIEGDQLRFSPIPSSSAIEMNYFERITPLDDTNTTNWIITNYPDVYLYGSCYQGSIFTRNDGDLQKFGALYAKALDELDRADDRARWGATPLVIRNDTSNP
jgi:hypothetical protein